MTVSYLDVDDEITIAVARLRAADDRNVLLVLPPGSRIATSRINFRLLAREALEHQRRLSIVSGDAGVRAIAVSAGLPAFGTVGEWEASVEEGRGGGSAATAASGAAAGGGDAAGATVATEEADTAEPAVQPEDEPTPSEPPKPPVSLVTAASATAVHPTPTPAAPIPASPPVRAAAAAPTSRGLGPRSAARDLPVDGRRVAGRPVWERLGRTPLLVAAGLAALVLVLGAAGGFLLLPTAAITVTPRAEPAGPVTVTIRADPGATSVDAANAVVPAETITLPLQVSGDFKATGVKVEETRATGTVRFRSENTIEDVPIPAGTRVSTRSGVAFVTTAGVTVPRASFATGPTTRNAPVQAVEPGTSGNVGANTITREPATLQAKLISVTNPEPTSGGTRTETKLVAKKDYDAALKQLTTRLGEQLQAMLADPATAPAGRTLFPDTAVMSPAAADTAVADLVGQEAETFTLGATASATVTAVDESQLEPLAVARLRQTVPAGFELFEDSIRSSHAAGTADGTAVIYVAEASGEQWRPLDEKALLDSVKGQPVAEARVELERVGRVDISTWPDWVETIPTLDARVSLTVAAPERAAP